MKVRLHRIRWLSTPRDAESFLARAGIALRYHGKGVALASLRAATGPEHSKAALVTSITLVNHLLGTATAIEVHVIADRVVLVHRSIMPALYALVRRGRALTDLAGLSLHARAALRMIHDRRQLSVGEVRSALGLKTGVRPDPADEALAQLGWLLLVDRGPFEMPRSGVPYLSKEGYPYHLFHQAHADLVKEAAAYARDDAADAFVMRYLDGGQSVTRRTLASLFKRFLTRDEIAQSIDRLVAARRAEFRARCRWPSSVGYKKMTAPMSKLPAVTPRICDTILDAIGHTPMVRLNRITRGIIPATVLAKVETFNPGNSIKDRMAVKMIEDAERAGLLKPGGTIIEGTSGNTGMGLAIAAVVKGYKCIFTTTDKQSKEKADALRAFGAEVIVCPTNVDPEDPRSYYAVSSRLERETPNSWKANQYDNLSNSQAHYEQTGPEIWDQTDGRITHLVSGVGTGGTACGAGRYLKEKNPKVKVFGIDTYGSVFKKYKETGIFDKNEIYPYVTEGIGEDFLPKNVDFSIIDHFEKVTDKDAAVMTRRIAREEGIFAGNSAGSAMAGLLQLRDRFTKDDVVVVIFHDHGTRYLGKMFNDDWMRKKGYLDKTGLTGRDLVSAAHRVPLVTLERTDTVARAAQVMTENDFSQIPVTDNGRLIGSINETRLYAEIVKRPDIRDQPIDTIMQPAFPFADISAGIDALAAMITPESPAVLVRDFKSDETYIITRSDVIKALS